MQFYTSLFNFHSIIESLSTVCLNLYKRSVCVTTRGPSLRDATFSPSSDCFGFPFSWLWQQYLHLCDHSRTCYDIDSRKRQKGDMWTSSLQSFLFYYCREWSGMDVSTKTNEDHFLRRDKGASPEIQRLCQSKCKYVIRLLAEHREMNNFPRVTDAYIYNTDATHATSRSV